MDFGWHFSMRYAEENVSIRHPPVVRTVTFEPRGSCFVSASPCFVEGFRMKPMLISMLLAAIAFVLAVLRIDPGLVDSGMLAGPGLTLDESFNIGQGIYLFESFCDHGPLMFTPSTAHDVFGEAGYLADHPPLGRFVLGAAHQLTAPWISGAELSLFNVPAARIGSCFCFAITTLLLSEFARRRYGVGTAVMAAAFFMLMPRAVGHARIASLESATTLFWLATLLPLLAWWTEESPPTTRQCLVSGFLWGLLLLTKVQGILIPPLVVAWAVWQHRLSAIRPLITWSLTGCVVFFVGWPWLWLEPIANTLQYLGRASDRPTLYVWYLGERFADKSVPWHFPFVMLLATTPFCVIPAVCWRLLVRLFQPEEVLAVASILWPLIVFALPGTPVYDGVRLFLVVLPVLAMIAARGVAFMWMAVSFGLARSSTENPLAGSEGTPLRISGGRRPLFACGLLVAMAAATIVSAAVHRPFCLDDYPGVPGGSKTAVEMLGLEASYWADGLNGDFWKQVPEGSVVYVAPVSHQFQLSDVEQLVPVVRQRRIKLLPFQYDPQQQRGLLLLIHRLADLPPLLRHVPEGATIIASAQFKGVVLAQLIDTSVATWPSRPKWPGED